jgi:hypothetical protein
MKIAKKKLLFLILFFSIACLTAIGQFTKVPTKISTPRGTVTVQTLQYTPHYYYGNTGTVKQKYGLSIVLLNDSVISEKATLDISVMPNTLEYGKKDGKTIIRPSETKEVYRMENGVKITGIAADSCWLFLVGDNKIKTYSIIPEKEYPKIDHIQKGEGQILPLTKENLVAIVADNEKALKLAEKGKLLKALETYNAK